MTHIANMDGRWLLLFSVISIVDGYICPPGWKQNGDNCYYFTSRRELYKNWVQAGTVCEQMQGELLSIETSDEAKWLEKEMNRQSIEEYVSLEWWTGLTDIAEPNKWVWEDSLSEVNSTIISWAPKYPERNDEKKCRHVKCNRCALVSTHYTYQFKASGSIKKSTLKGLVQQSCDVKLPYICKRRLISESPSKCDYGDGWLNIDNACWKLVKEKRGWHEAQSHCENVEQGRLATVHSVDQQNALLTVTFTGFYNYWIGLKVNKTGSTISGVWVDGATLDDEGHVTYWAEDEPRFENTNKGCVYMSNVRSDRNGWKYDSCTDERSFVCQRPMGVCPIGWYTYHGRCYEAVVNFHRSWQGAFDYCKNQNTSLMEISSTWEYRFLTIGTQAIASLGVDSFWLGFKSTNGENIWQTSGTNVTEIPVNTPANLQPYMCGIYFTDNDPDDARASLSDNCANLHPFICEAGAKDTVIDYRRPPRTTYCAWNQFVYRGKCYSFNSEKLSWYDAKAACRNASSELVVIQDSQEQAFINSHSTQIYWIGLSKYGKSLKWRGNGKDAPYENFIYGYAKSLLANENNCVQLIGMQGQYKGKWTPKGCQNLFPYICVKPGEPTEPIFPTTPVVDPNCGEGWMAADNSCYQLNKEDKQWTDAQSDCLKKAGQLTSIANGAEQKIIENLIPRVFAGLAIWIGGSDRNQDSSWKWVDETPFAYINWLQGKVTGESPLCISLSVANKQWLQLSCQAKQSYICKKPKTTKIIIPTLPPPATVVPAGKQKVCPNTYVMSGSHCYKFYNQSVDQELASRTCKNDGGNLASTASELEDINEIHSAWVFGGHRDTPLWWIGLEDRDNDGQFTWTDGSPVTYTDWGRRQPAATPAQAQCVMMTHKKAQWEVRSCTDIADGFICRTEPQLGPVTASTVRIQDVCPYNSYFMSSTSCYFMSQSRFTWANAKKYCESSSMELLFMDNIEEEQFITRKNKLYGVGKYWLNYVNVNGTYKIDGHEIDLEYAHQYMGSWNSKHTGNEFGSCVYVDTQDNTWHDESCTEIMAFVCKAYRKDYYPEPPLISDICPSGWNYVDGQCYKVTYVSLISDTCPSGWNYVDGQCYKVFHSYIRSAKKSWYSARRTCTLLGGDLASLHGNMADISKTRTVFKNRYNQIYSGIYWIGLNKLDFSMGYRWSDGTPFDYSAWGGGEPNYLGMSEECVVAEIDNSDNVKWVDMHCSTAQNFVCQIPSGSAPVTLPPSTVEPTTSHIPGVRGKCERDWVQYKQKCFYFDNDYYSWLEASDSCAEKGGQLATIHSRGENDFIISQITQSSQGHWSIGLTSRGRTGWQWVDDSAMDFVAWHEGEPSNHGGAEQCAEIYNDRGFWNDGNCGTISRGHICEKPVNGITLPPKTTVQPYTGYCQQGFQLIGDTCYGIFGDNDKVNWTDAQTACRSFGTGYDLVTVTGLREQSILIYLTSYINSSAWIGFSDSANYRTFTWSNNDQVTVTYWLEGEPGYGNYGKRCARVIGDRMLRALWKAGSCEEEHAYVCSGPKDRTITTPPTSSSTKCTKPGYQEFEGQCYKLDTALKSFNWARYLCQQDGGDLVSIADAVENAYVHVMVADLGVDDIWLGMVRTTYEVELGQIVGNYQWDDGWPVLYSNWANNQPRHVEGQDNCVAMSTVTGEWNSTLCKPNYVPDEKLSVCKISNKQSPTPPDVRYLCPDSRDFAYDDKCFRAFMPRYGKSWQDAAADCIHESMSLASVHDGFQNDFLLDYLKQQDIPQDVWIGLTKRRNGGWVWRDGSEVEYEQWNSQEPDLTSDSICGFMVYLQGGYWADAPCSHRKGWICQSDAVSVTKPTTPTTPTTTTIPTTTAKMYCHGDTNWKYFNESCYYIGTERISWHDASQKCSAMDASLASLHGSDEVDFILKSQSVSQYIMAIGFTRLGRGNWEWMDNSLVDYTNWWKDEPNNHDRSEQCAFMFTHTNGDLYERGRWNDQHCDTLGAYVCKKSENPKPTTLGPSIQRKPGHCPSEFAEYGNKCIGLFGIENPLNWTDARETCRAMYLGADLISIHNAKEQAFLTSQLYNADRSVWIGLSDRFWNHHYWWSNNEQVVYTNWLDREPNRRENHECVEMSFHEHIPGKWRNEPCSYLNSYICGMPKDSAIPTSEPNPHDSSCPEDYHYWAGSCYKAEEKRVSWHKAEQACEADGAKLTSVSSPFEQAFVESLLVFYNQPVWIGLWEAHYDSSNTNTNRSFSEFFWKNGWPVTYTNWDNGRPVGTERGEFTECVTLNPSNGLWNDTFCYMTYGYVCKKTDLIPVEPIVHNYMCNNTQDLLFGAKCFRYGGDNRKSWSDSHLECLKDGYELASVHSYDENVAILDMLQATGNPSNVWIGLIRNNKGGFYWLDQSPVQWAYWSAGEPSDDYANEDCTELVYNRNGMWNDLPCRSYLNYLCERPAIIKEVPTTSPGTRNPPGEAGSTALSRSSSNNNGPVIAGVVIGVLILCIVGGLVATILWRRYKAKSSSFSDFNATYSQDTDTVNVTGGVSFTNKMFNADAEASPSDT